MAPMQMINSFTKITFDETKRPLVICDIDHTFIKGEFDFNTVMMFLSTNRRLNRDFNVLYQETNHWMELSYNSGYICQTDPTGFQSMLDTIRALNGKLIFLTARSSAFHDRTLRDLSKVGLETPENYEIHYTNNMISKGEYLRIHRLADDYDHITFIDDNQDYLDSVYHTFPKIMCYKFNYSS